MKCNKIGRRRKNKDANICIVLVVEELKAKKDDHKNKTKSYANEPLTFFLLDI